MKTLQNEATGFGVERLFRANSNQTQNQDNPS